jgi:predicted RND superfamily exporter protein
MSVVVLALLCAVVVTVAGFLVAMFVRDRPSYGAMGLLLLLGPGTVLPFVYVALAHG